LWKENYRPFGERQKNASSSWQNQIWFANKPYDATTGLSYMGARYYNPMLGRFMGVDPKGFDENSIYSFNRYAYANNNPYKFVDPDGHSPMLVVALPMAAGWLIGGTFNAATQYATTGHIQWGGIGGVFDAASDGAMFGLAGAGAAGRANVGRVGAASSAEAAADIAQAAGRTSGAAAELRVGDKVFTDVSTGGAARTLHPEVKAALDKVPQSQRAPWHGHCAEAGCLSQALNSGVNPAGGTSRAVNIGNSGRGHGTSKPACSSCKDVLNQFGVKHD
jgi:RHS repeat-associated protein